jgi:hypothetical protein
VQIYQHEMFARAFVMYMRQGKALSPVLADGFVKFRAWVTELYPNEDTLNVTLTPEMRTVFDRMHGGRRPTCSTGNPNRVTGTPTRVPGLLDKPVAEHPSELTCPEGRLSHSLPSWYAEWVRTWVRTQLPPNVKSLESLEG